MGTVSGIIALIVVATVIAVLVQNLDSILAFVWKVFRETGIGIAIAIALGYLSLYELLRERAIRFHLRGRLRSLGFYHLLHRILGREWKGVYSAEHISTAQAHLRVLLAVIGLLLAGAAGWIAIAVFGMILAAEWRRRPRPPIEAEYVQRMVLLALQDLGEEERRKHEDEERREALAAVRKRRAFDNLQKGASTFQVLWAMGEPDSKAEADLLGLAHWRWKVGPGRATIDFAGGTVMTKEWAGPEPPIPPPSLREDFVGCGLPLLFWCAVGYWVWTRYLHDWLGSILS